MLDADAIQAFVISLTHAHKRRESIDGNLGGQIAYEIVDAISGADVKADERQYCKSLFCARFFRNMSHNEVACSASHRKAMVRFLETGAKYGLILEDDAYIPADNFAKILDAANAIGEFDLLKLGGVGPYASEGVVKATVGDVHVLATLTFGVCAHGYLVSRAGASKLISTILPVREPYDAFLRNVHVHKCSVFETSPWIVTLHDEFNNSTIGGERKAIRGSYSLRENIASMKFRISYNVMRRACNLRRFGFAYITRAGFTKTMPSGS
jgi:glycosyl transferase, family 25